MGHPLHQFSFRLTGVDRHSCFRQTAWNQRAFGTWLRADRLYSPVKLDQLLHTPGNASRARLTNPNVFLNSL